MQTSTAISPSSIISSTFDVPDRIRDNAPLMVAGAAAVGALIGAGGAKAVKGLLVIGIAVAAAAMVFGVRRP